ncbi:hypothetical protein PRK78_005952 [Emydomyces testavorans]|uniref:Myb-like domain-containing protein n=1 Tax=Emydomyces testavorans TaxID=2070801 RepID=A0AAF0DKI5_9EURO|nr:hypothetical protein PRK78_005952 [Emydomyces testavorans]
MSAANNGRWTKEEDIFVAAMRLGTSLNWGQIETLFPKTFKGITPSKKDLESRFNKNLKPKLDIDKEKRTVADIIDDYRHYGKATYPEDQEVIDQALIYLSSVEESDRLW